MGPFWYHCLHFWKEMLKFLKEGQCCIWCFKNGSQSIIIQKKDLVFHNVLSSSSFHQMTHDQKIKREFYDTALIIIFHTEGVSTKTSSKVNSRCTYSIFKNIFILSTSVSCCLSPRARIDDTPKGFTCKLDLNHDCSWRNENVWEICKWWWKENTITKKI